MNSSNIRYLLASILLTLFLFNTTAFAAGGFGSVSDQRNEAIQQAAADRDAKLAQATKLKADELVLQFEAAAKNWGEPIVKVAMTIFWTLAILEFILCFGKLAIVGTDFSEVTIELFRRILILSFGWYLLQETTIFGAIITGFQDTAALATGQATSEATTAGGLFTIVAKLLGGIYTFLKTFSVSELPEAMLMVVTTGIILWGLGTAAAQMLLVLCEMYIVISVGLLTLGLYSLEMTREYPMKFFGAIIGTGMKLFTLQLILGLGVVMVKRWIDIGALDVTSYMIMAASAIAYKEIAVKVPDYIQGLFSGSPGSGISAGGAVAAAGVVAAVAAAPIPGKGAAGTVMGISQAASLGKAQGASGAGLVGATLKNLGSAAVGVGQEGAANTLGGRVGAFNSQKAAELAADNIGKK